MSDAVAWARSFLFWFSSIFANTLVFAFLLFIHLSFLFGTGLFPALAADNAFPSAESPPRLPRVASTQRRGLLEALSHLLMEESSKLISGENNFSLKVKS